MPIFPPPSEKVSTNFDAARALSVHVHRAETFDHSRKRLLRRVHSKAWIQPLLAPSEQDVAERSEATSRVEVERGTGFEPATTSLEGWCSATELPPPVTDFIDARSAELFQSQCSRVLVRLLAHSERNTDGWPSAARRRPPSLILGSGASEGILRSSFALLRRAKDGGQGGIRTPEGVSQQIYSLPPLAAWVPARLEA